MNNSLDEYGKSLVHFRRRRFYMSHRTRTGYLMLLPSLVIFGVFVFYPVFYSIYMSMHEWSLASKVFPFIGLNNYQKILQDDLFWNALGNTLKYTIGVVIGGMMASLALAIALNSQIRGKTILRAIYYLPSTASMVIISIIWTFMLDPNLGIFSEILKTIGLNNISFLNNPTLALPTLVVVAIWKNIGYYAVILIAGLQGIPDIIYEASMIDGANRQQQFFRITLPLLSPTILFVLTIMTINSFQVFDQVYVMTQGGPLHTTDTLVSYIFDKAFNSFNLGYASALSYVLFILTLGFTLLQFRSFGFFRSKSNE